MSMVVSEISFDKKMKLSSLAMILLIELCYLVATMLHQFPTNQ